MQTQAIGGTTNSAARSLMPRGLGTLKSEDFFKLLVTELRQQDPFEPAKTADMIGQVSQIRGIELSAQLTGTLDALAKNQRTSGAGDLIGKYVSAAMKGADGAERHVEGVVTGVHFDENGATVLELDTGEAVAAAEVVSITTLQEAQRRQTAQNAAGNAANAPDPAKADATAKPLFSFGGISIG